MGQGSKRPQNILSTMELLKHKNWLVFFAYVDRPSVLNTRTFFVIVFNKNYNQNLISLLLKLTSFIHIKQLTNHFAFNVCLGSVFMLKN